MHALRRGPKACQSGNVNFLTVWVKFLRQRVIVETTRASEALRTASSDTHGGSTSCDSQPDIRKRLKRHMKKARRSFGGAWPGMRKRSKRGEPGDTGGRRHLLAGVISTVTLYSVSATPQSSVTLYGLVDAGVRYTTHANLAGDSRVQMTSSASESTFGIKGAKT